MAALSFHLPKRWQPASVWLLYIVGLLPAAWTFYLGASDQLGADPVKTFERFLGLWAILVPVHKRLFFSGFQGCLSTEGCSLGRWWYRTPAAYGAKRDLAAMWSCGIGRRSPGVL
jgi:hypothetical protein